MKIKEIQVKNFRSLKDVTLKPRNLMALVGRNNSGKSNVLKALELFFDGSTRLIDKECFFQHELDKPIEIKVTFNQLNLLEKEQFGAWLCGDELIVGKEFASSGDESFLPPIVSAETDVPQFDFLQIDKINGDKITEWWSNKESLLNIGSPSFLSSLGTSKPTVSKWKEEAKKFISDQPKQIQWKREKLKNPVGYSGVLKGYLPEFIYVPAVRNVLDETKVAKTNPFGKLVHSIIEKISETQLQNISEQLESIQKQLNRDGGEARLTEIKDVEARLNSLMAELMECDIEIEVPLPKVKDVFSDAKIYANDGMRTPIETKGHGLQRSMIFTILRAYAEQINKRGDEKESKTTIFAFEEPELYLHPQMQRNLSDTLRKISEGPDQVFYTTHSSLFVNVGHFDDICIMRRKKVEGVLSSFPTQLSIDDLLTDLKIRKNTNGTEFGIRELYSNAFNSLVNEGFFADKVVIVEGLSEEYILPIYARALSFDLDRNNVSVVNAGGKGPIDRLLRIFDGFDIPTFVVFDGDKENSDSEIKNKSKELLEMLGDPKPDIDNLKTEVKDNFAVFEKTLEAGLANEVIEYSDLCKEAGDKIGPVGKPLTHRYMAIKLLEKINNGSKAEDIVPITIQAIINKIKHLEISGEYLKRNEASV